MSSKKPAKTKDDRPSRGLRCSDTEFSGFAEGLGIHGAEIRKAGVRRTFASFLLASGRYFLKNPKEIHRLKGFGGTSDVVKPRH